MTEVCFLLAEFEHKQYRALAAQMVESAKLRMKSARIVQLSDEHTEPLAAASSVVRTPFGPEQMMLARAQLLKDYAPNASANLVMCDADVIWQQDPAPLFDGSFDIGLAWRGSQPAMPYCGGFVMVRHGSEAARALLTEWWWTIATMPAGFHRWWGDQLALAILLGKGKPNTIANFNGCRVRLFDAGDVLFQVAEGGQQAPPQAICRHYKGKVKAEMIAKGTL